MNGKNKAMALKIILIYAFVISLWILFSDKLINILQPGAEITVLHLYKDWLYVIVSSAVFFIIIARYLRKITEVQSEYEKSQEKLRSVVEYSTNLFYAHDTNHVLTYMSPQTEKFFDCSPEEALIHWTEFATDNPINQAGYDSTQRAIDTGIAQPPFELELVGKKGRVIWVQVNEAPVVKNGKTVAIVGALTDITERKKAEVALREREYMLTEAQIISNFGSWKFDFKKNETTWQEQTYYIYGVSPADFVPTVQSQMSLIYPEDRPAMEMWLKQSSISKKLPSLEFRIIRPIDNHIRYLVGQGQTFFDSEGNPDYVIGVVKDVTNVKLAQKKIHESEERYRTLAEAAQDMIFIIGTNGLVTYVNDFAAQQFGSTPEEIIGKSPELLFPNFSGKQRLNLRKVFEEKTPIYEESEIEFIPEKKIWVGTRIVPITNNAGQVKEILGISRNITEQKNSEDNLHIEKEYSDEIINSLPGIFYMFDKQGTFIRWNKNLERVTGYSTEEISKKDPTDLFSGDDKLLIASKINEALTEGKASAEANIVTKDGKQIPYFFSAIRFIQNGELYLIGEGVNIVERKRAVEALKESEEKYRSLVEQSLIGVAYIQDNKIIYSNPRLADMFGYTVDEILSLDAVSELITPDDRARVSEKMRKRISGEEPEAHYIFKGLRKDGKTIEVEVHGTRIMYKDRPAIMSSLLDITDRKKAEESLKESEEKYHELIDTANDAIFVADAVDGTIIDTNLAASRLLGKPEDEIIGMHQADLHPKDEAEHYRKIFMESIKSGKNIISDLYIVRSDGTRVPVEISASVTEIKGRKIIQGIFRDITERIQAQEALKQRDRDIRKAYVDVFSAVTGDRLIIMTNEEIEENLGDPLIKITHVSSDKELSSARSNIKESIMSFLPEDKLDDVITAASEALTNAVKHAGNGDFQTFQTKKMVQIRVEDKGPGINFSVLPKATLLTGFSTKQSLGMGFSFMLEFCDRVLLSTQPGNTTIVLEINKKS